MTGLPIVVHCPGCGLPVDVEWTEPAVTLRPGARPYSPEHERMAHGHLLVTVQLDSPNHTCPDPTTDRATDR